MREDVDGTEIEIKNVSIGAIPEIRIHYKCKWNALDFESFLLIPVVLY